MNRFLDEIQEPLGIELSELHGFLSAIICGYKNPENVSLKSLLEKEYDLVLTEMSLSKIKEEYYKTLEQIVGFSFDYDIYLTNTDEDDLSACLKSLSLWTKGFLFGLGISDIDKQLQDNPIATEILKDIAEISKIDVDEGDYDKQASYDFMHLVEYCKVAVQNLRVEMYQNSKDEIKIN